MKAKDFLTNVSTLFVLAGVCVLLMGFDGCPLGKQLGTIGGALSFDATVPEFTRVEATLEQVPLKIVFRALPISGSTGAIEFEVSHIHIVDTTRTEPPTQPVPTPAPPPPVPFTIQSVPMGEYKLQINATLPDGNSWVGYYREGGEITLSATEATSITLDSANPERILNFTVHIRP